MSLLCLQLVSRVANRIGYCRPNAAVKWSEAKHGIFKCMPVTHKNYCGSVNCTKHRVSYNSLTGARSRNT